MTTPNRIVLKPKHSYASLTVNREIDAPDQVGYLALFSSYVMKLGEVSSRDFEISFEWGEPVDDQLRKELGEYHQAAEAEAGIADEIQETARHLRAELEEVRAERDKYRDALATVREIRDYERERAYFWETRAELIGIKLDHILPELQEARDVIS